MVFRVLTPPENGAGEFSSPEKKVNISQEKLGSRVVQVETINVYSEIHVYNLQ